MTFHDLSLRVIRSVYYRNDANWNYPSNQYPYNSLYCILGGDGYVEINGEITPLYPMSVYLIPPNTQFSCWCENRIEKMYIEFSAELVPGLDLFSGLSSICRADVPLSLFPSYELLPNKENEIYLSAVQEYQTLSQQLDFKGTLLQILSKFIDDTWALPDSRHYKFKPVLDDINGTLSASMRIGDIAKRHGWHPSTLSRAFRKNFGCSLKHYMEELLATRLKQELLTSDKTIRELAFFYGFSDAYYLSAFFKRMEGASPSSYRENNRRLY